MATFRCHGLVLLLLCGLEAVAPSTTMVWWQAPSAWSAMNWGHAAHFSDAWGQRAPALVLRAGVGAAVAVAADGSGPSSGASRARWLGGSAAAQGVVAPTRPDTAKGARNGGGTGVKRAAGRGRPTGKRPADSLTKFVRGTDRAKLLEHADEILLCKRVQLLRRVELSRTQLAEESAKKAEAEGRSRAVLMPVGRAPTGLPGIELDLDEPAISHADWAAAAGVSVDELQTILNQGRQAEAAIIASNVGLIKSAIAGMKRTSGGQIDQGTTEQDLMQEGSLAIVKAAAKFDVELGLRFSTYATYWVRNALTMTIRDTTRTIRLPQRLQLTYSKIHRATEELRANSNWEPTDEQVAERVGGLTPQKVREVRAQVRTRAASLDAIIGDDRVLGEIIPDARQDGEAVIVQEMMQRHLRRLMEQYLSPQEVRVVSLRFGLDDDGEARSLRAVSEEVDISYSRVKNMLFTALTKLRRPHVAGALRDYVTGEDGGIDFTL